MAAPDPEDLWLDLIDAEDSDDRDEQLRLAKRILKLDDTHVDAWWALAKLELPAQGAPTLVQASRCLRACKQVIELDIDHRDAWWRGGQILVEDLGMLEGALNWWQRRREASPSDPEPLIEQVAILADLGLYSDAADRLAQLWAEGMESMMHSQLRRAARLHSIVKKAALREKKDIFQPWDSEHEGWKEVEWSRNRKPAQESTQFLLIAGPLVLLEVTYWNSIEFGGSVIWPMLMGFMLVLLTVLFCIRASKWLSLKLNKPAYNMVRAMDVEVTSGMVCIPDGWRGMKLYLALVKLRAPAWQTRLLRIIDADEKLPAKWRPDIGDLSTVDLILSEEE
ncbi:MAG: hypothetical protein CXX71_02060 [Methanobacteriota archaeon]|nr:MAG: hypothetical protein CXX71_02060 [Euryarchaeota archaeon]